ncbi:Kinesin motor domain protein [Giardia duodenalis]|uniref:Kinesin motor domain protein n=1 Tax=Giardia intestinalis TaxID=5741 RepID=V6T909_GIAIN|nr:Kinesin motor domain protein [Giardia intestinalis]
MSDRLQFTIVHVAERRKFKITVRVEDVPNVRVRMLKKSIFQATGIPVDCQALYLNKQLLSDRMTGSELELSPETTFVLHTSTPAQEEQLDIRDQDNPMDGAAYGDEKSKSRGRSRSRSRSRSRGKGQTSHSNRRDTFGAPLFEGDNGIIDGYHPKSMNPPINELNTTAENLSSPNVINAHMASRDATLQSAATRHFTIPTKDCTRSSPRIQRGGTDKRSTTQSIGLCNSSTSSLRDDSVKSIVVKAAGRSSSQQKTCKTSSTRSVIKSSYFEPPVSYPKMQSAKSTKKRSQPQKPQTPQKSPHQSGAVTVSPRKRLSNSNYEPCPPKGESYSPTDSPPLIPATNHYTKTKELTTSRISLTDLHGSDRMYASTQPEFPAKTTKITVPQPSVVDLQLHQSILSASKGGLLEKPELTPHARLADSEMEETTAESKVANDSDYPSFTEDDIELLRQMNDDSRADIQLVENISVQNMTRDHASQKQPHLTEELALVSELQEQVTLIKQEMDTIKRTIASTPTSNAVVDESVLSAHTLQGSKKLCDQFQEAPMSDWSLFKHKYDEELAALKLEVEQLRNARDLARSSSNTATHQPPPTSESHLDTTKATRDTFGTLTTDESIELDVNDVARRSSNTTPTTIRPRQSDGPPRPPSAKVLGITKSQQNSSLLAIQTIKQQIEAERAELTEILQNLEVYSLIDTFFDIEIEIANIEHSNMTQALEESRTSLADIQNKLSYALSKTPTFTPDVRKSAEISLDYGMFQREYTRLQGLMVVENKQRKTLHNTLEEMKGSIRVIVRMRPMLQHEKEELKTSKFRSFNYRNAFIFKDEHTLQLKLPYGVASQENYSFDFYKILDETKTQEDVFHDMSHLLKSVIDGYNVCVLAYGCTGSGKTFTLIGDDSETAVAESVVMSMQKDPEEKNPYERLGLLPRSIVELFNLIEADTSQSQRYELRCAMIEHYLDNILDLLHTEDDTRTQLPSFNSDKLVVRQTAKGETYIQNLSYKTVASAEELVGYLGYGLERRHIAATKLNSLSSRSHTVFLIEITSYRETAKGTRTARSVLTFADLAGSENVTKSHSNGLRLKEAQHINTSLCALGDVIAALSRKKVASYVPYRNNKLTMILQQSLGNNSKTLLFANISPLPNLLYETLSTLSFAARVKNVKNVAVKNLTSIESDQ